MGTNLCTLKWSFSLCVVVCCSLLQYRVCVCVCVCELVPMIKLFAWGVRGVCVFITAVPLIKLFAWGGAREEPGT